MCAACRRAQEVSRPGFACVSCVYSARKTESERGFRQAAHGSSANHGRTHLNNATHIPMRHFHCQHDLNPAATADSLKPCTECPLCLFRFDQEIVWHQRKMSRLPRAVRETKSDPSDPCDRFIACRQDRLHEQRLFIQSIVLAAKGRNWTSNKISSGGKGGEKKSAGVRQFLQQHGHSDGCCDNRRRKDHRPLPVLGV